VGLTPAFYRMVMTAAELIVQLGYANSRHFITPEKADALPEGELAFAIRRLAQPAPDGSGNIGRFHGAYVLQDVPGGPAVPVVYVIETPDDAMARRIHRLVWNQNLAPFVIVVSPQQVRLYPGFAYELGADAPLVMVVAESVAALEMLAAFRATAIDDGTVWREWGHAADPARRSDESLLRDLKELDRVLQKDHGVPRGAAHGLIGKYVYLRYLRDRDILSDRKLADSDWKIDPRDLFTRHATLKAFWLVNEKLQGWLNGSVFRLGDEALADIAADQLKAVASVFAGDTPQGQLYLSFAAYDFSHIPIETLSCVYEQFLHNTGGTGPSRGKSLAAYYTPIPLADYMISELERRHPLRPGMKVLDPSCGSGAFLVQCYRRLIEKEMRVQGRALKKSELRDLLVGSIFGLDLDDDACRVTELSLILTLLDYVTPPDLEDTNFKLPTLRGQNIFKDDFFNDQGEWSQALGGTRFDWCIGNPPWAEVKGTPAKTHHHHLVAHWMTTNEDKCPTGGHQIAEAFLWKAATHLAKDGVSGLLVPAMTWFKKESVAFRKEFFGTHRVWCLANFANLAYVLFAGRAEVPAAAVFYRAEPPGDDDTILTFAPFVAEQVANRPDWEKRKSHRAPKRKKGDIKLGATWNIVVNHADMRDVPLAEAREGAGLAWKLAMWGTGRDARVLERMARKHANSLSAFLEQSHLEMAQGSELKDAETPVSDAYQERQDLKDRLTIDFNRLKGVGRIFSFPEWTRRQITEDEAYLRIRGGTAGLPVSEPPHLVLDASRRFAVFSKEFIFIPPRQVGIGRMTAEKLRELGLSEAAIRDDEPVSRMLRTLSLYLSSDFCTYHQFLMSPKWGVDQNLADLHTLKQLPVPLNSLSESESAEWLELHRQLTALSEKRFSVLGWNDLDEQRFETLLADANARVFRLLGLRPVERWLVEDFVGMNLELNKGKVTAEAMREPSPDEVARYFKTLRDGLDGFLPAAQGLRHKVDALTAPGGAFFSVAARRTSEAIAPTITADAAAAATLRQMRDKLRTRHSQWVYFDRGLKRYEYKSGVFYQFKPMHRLHWTRRQAVLDADEIIAETLEQSGGA
jgi:hypothetical protein